MFTDKDVFKNTAENLNFILETYGDEFRVWAADKVSQEQIQPQGQPQTQEQIQPQIESQSQVQSENFTSGISQHPRLGERFSAFGRHIPNKIFEQVKTLAKKYDGFYDQSFLKSFSFPTAQKRNTFIQHASALIKGKPFEEFNSNPDTAPVAQNSLPQAEEKTSKNATPADLENKIYEIIPHDKFITEEDILNRVEEIEPNELPTSLLALEMKGLIEEDAGRYKRTQKLPTANNNAVAKNATEKLDVQANEQSQPQLQEQLQIKPVQEQSAANNAAPSKNNERYEKTTKAIRVSRTKYPVRYKVAEANELSTSHIIEGLGVVKNPNYKGVQPHNRERADMQARLIQMAQKFDPELALDQALSVNAGAVAIRNDGTVLNGNGRAAALIDVYKNGKGDAYKTALTERAQDFGLNADEISKMNQPVLVNGINLSDTVIKAHRRDVTTIPLEKSIAF